MNTRYVRIASEANARKKLARQRGQIYLEAVER
jgi:hypothetical protein